MHMDLFSKLIMVQANNVALPKAFPFRDNLIETYQ